MRIQRTITIEYEWGSEHGEQEHVASLEDAAEERINQLRAEGYTSGMLEEEICSVSTEKTIFYRGWWRVRES